MRCHFLLGLFLITLLSLIEECKAQELYTYEINSLSLDSQKQVLHNAKSDKERCSALLQLLVKEKKEIELEKYSSDLCLISKKNMQLKKNSLVETNFFKAHFASALERLATIADRKGDQKKAIAYFTEALQIRREIGHIAGTASTLSSLGVLLEQRGELKLSIKYSNEALSKFQEINDKGGIARTYQVLGSTYQNLGDFKKAIEMQSQSLIIYEKLGDSKGLARALNNLGTLSNVQGDFNKALEYLEKSLALREELDDKVDLTNSLNNVGVIYNTIGQSAKSFSCFQRALSISESIQDKKGIGRALNNMALNYYKNGDPDIIVSKEASIKAGQLKAIPILKRSLKVHQEIGNKRGVISTLNHFGYVYIYMKNYSLALPFAQQAKKESELIGYVEYIRKSANQLYKIYKSIGKDELALQNYELFIQLDDSIKSESNRKAIVKSQLKYEYEKQAAADSVAHAKESEIKNAEIEKQTAEINAQKNQQYALFGGLGLVMIFAGFMYNRFKVTQKQKGIIEEQKEVVEEQKKLVEVKQKEILDSIKYARRIQLALIPTEKQLTKILEKLKL